MTTLPHLLVRTLLGTFLLCLMLPAAASDYAVVQQIRAVASGQGEPDGVFGWSVAVDGDLAVAADLRLSGLPARVRTYVRNGTNWNYQAGQDIPIFGDSGSNLSLNGDTLIMTGYRSVAPSQSVVSIHRRQGSQWVREHGLSSTTNFFDAVAADDHITVVGIWNHDGAAGTDQGRIQILRRQPNGNWSSTYLTPTTPQAGARFGQSVAIVAGAIVVGAPYETVTDGAGTHARAGAAYVYELTGDTWNQVARLVEPQSGSHAQFRFGQKVAISGADPSTPDRLLVSRESNLPGGRTGIVRGYRRLAGTWTPSVTLSAPTPSTSDQFGCSLAMDGDWAVIGACANSTAAAQAGAVFIARFSSTFSSVQSLTQRTDPQAGADDYMGSRVAVNRSGPTVMVGNLGAELYGNQNQGVVLVGRSQSGEVPSLARAIDLGQGLTGARGTVMAVDGDLLMLGAYGEDVGFQQQRGAVYVYRRQPDGTYAFESRLLAPDGTANDQFGWRIALKGDVALISAAGRNHMGMESAGAVYAFHREGVAWTLEAQFLPPAPVYETSLGFTLDFDGTTAFMGRRDFKTAVMQRSANGAWTSVQEITDVLAYAVQVEGDVAMIGDSSGSNGHVGEVAIYARVGGVWQPNGVLYGSDVDQRFGWDVSLHGNTAAVASISGATPVQVFQRNGNTWLPQGSLLPDDVTATVLCGNIALEASMLAMGCSDSSLGYRGSVYLFTNTAGIWNQSQKLTLPDPVDYDGFGSDLAWNAQGTLLAGASGRNVDFIDQGAVYVYQNDVLFKNGFD